MSQSQHHTTHLPGPVELFKEAWGVFTYKFWSLAGVFGVSFLLTLISFLVALIVGFALFFLFGQRIDLVSGLILGLVVLVFLIFFLYISFVFQIAYLVVISEKGEKQSLKQIIAKARKYVSPIVITSLLGGLIIFGGYLLLVIPGIILAIWFSLSQFVVINEQKKGLLALHTSHEYIRGRFWQVLWRMISVYLPFALLGFLSAFMPEDSQLLVNSLLQLISVFAGPFYVAYTYVLYEHLKKTSKSPTNVPSGEKKMYLFIPIIGLVLVLVSFFFIFSA